VICAGLAEAAITTADLTVHTQGFPNLVAEDIQLGQSVTFYGPQVYNFAFEDYHSCVEAAIEISQLPRTTTPTVTPLQYDPQLNAEVDHLVHATTGNLRIGGLRLEEDVLIVTFSYATYSAAYTFETCDMPSLSKTGLGQLKSVEGGGVFDDDGQRLTNLMRPQCRHVTVPYGKSEGWVSYQVEPNVFQLRGLYSIGGTGYPNTTFEIE